MIKSLSQHLIYFRQVCVFGAGLDSRPWRLFTTEEINSVSNMHYYEVDFKEMFDYKIPTLAEAGASITCGKYHPITTDLSKPNWTDKLIASGFQPKERTVYVMEGFTG